MRTTLTTTAIALLCSTAGAAPLVTFDLANARTIMANGLTRTTQPYGLQTRAQFKL